MEETKSLVERSRAGNLDAYGQLVRRFEDMAFGYAYSLLGDFHLAEDAAQEAFVEAYRKLNQVRQPAAFPGWFRKVLWSQCQRTIRCKELPCQPMEAEMASRTADPADALVKAELKDSVLAAIQALPENERTVTTLFYINGYSQEEIAGFLEVPVTTVKSRLHTSRGRLKERMLNMVKDELHKHVPGERLRKRIFAELVKNKTSLGDGLGAFPALETERLRLRELRPQEDAAAWLGARPFASADREADFKDNALEQLVKKFEGVRSRFYDLKYVIYWAIALKSDDKMIGNVRYWEYMGHHNNPWAFATLQFEVAPGLWGTGIAPEAVRAAAAFGLTHLGFARMQCSILADDERRGKELVEAGFTREGRLRNWWYDEARKRWVDVWMFSLVKSDLEVKR